MKARFLLPLALSIFSTESSFATATQDFDFFYLTIGYSNSTVDFSNQTKSDIESSFDGLGTVSFTDQDSGLRAKAGYRWSEFLSLEVGYINFGENGYRLDIDSSLIDQYNQEVDVTGFQESYYEVFGLSAAAVFNYQIHDEIDLYGRLGVLNWVGENESEYYMLLQGDSIQRELSEKLIAKDISGTNVFWGLGLAYNINVFDIYAEYEAFTIENNDENQDVNSIGVGLRYIF